MPCGFVLESSVMFLVMSYIDEDSDEVIEGAQALYHPQNTGQYRDKDTGEVIEMPELQS